MGEVVVIVDVFVVAIDCWVSRRGLHHLEKLVNHPADSEFEHV